MKFDMRRCDWCKQIFDYENDKIKYPSRDGRPVSQIKIDFDFDGHKRFLGNIPDTVDLCHKCMVKLIEILQFEASFDMPKEGIIEV